MLFYRLKATPTSTGGAGSSTWSVKLSALLPSAYVNIQPKQLVFQPMLIRQLLIRSASDDTTYNAKLTDFDGIDIRRWDTVTEVVNDLTETPIVGDVTISIDTGSVDEAYTLLCIIEDRR
jgi:hypothetical protein